ncbi:MULTISPECIES: ABC transporter permease [Pseudoalteromonas]|uniref:Transport permease protein n=1 Tax=Pseudoalteromonas fuliginea TaxID=1872678 RepID=A0ABD3YEI7_9GAMM|nr:MULTISPECIES: ABC transporter permease [Pseudoalteromonas]ATG78124.1 ABC transporter [Pseudoalteromonas sp. 1_2015MBL_MicDiv]KDC53663.1 ABC transporter [Pseudoalteromonas fuliginea]KJZ27906.1 ABC transporter [Pseudoalteromonas fuliginea]
MWTRIYAIFIKELKQLSRDRMTFAMILMIPLVQLMLFGYAINTDARHIPVALVDFSQTSQSRAIEQAITATQSVNFVARYNSIEEAEQAIIQGKIKAVLYLPSDLTRRLFDHSLYNHQQINSSMTRPIGQWIVDGSDTVISSAIRGLRNMPLDEISNRPIIQKAPSFAVVQYFNPEQRTVVNIVPGLVAVILTMTMILFTSSAIVREQEQGNMEFLITTPVRPIELMVGKITPYVFVGLIQVVIILSVGFWVFSVPIHGGILSLLVGSILFIAASLTLGLMISTIAKTQLQAMQMTIFILLPSILLSGFMFPYEAMPIVAQWIAEALPATHFMRIIRAIVLRDASILILEYDAIWLGVFVFVGLIIASLRFNKTLE